MMVSYARQLFGLQLSLLSVFIMTKGGLELVEVAVYVVGTMVLVICGGVLAGVVVGVVVGVDDIFAAEVGSARSGKSESDKGGLEETAAAVPCVAAAPTEEAMATPVEGVEGIVRTGMVE